MGDALYNTGLSKADQDLYVPRTRLMRYLLLRCCDDQAEA